MDLLQSVSTSVEANSVPITAGNPLAQGFLTLVCFCQVIKVRDYSDCRLFTSEEVGGNPNQGNYCL
jgi:hypothetical protein